MLDTFRPYEDWFEEPSSLPAAFSERDRLTGEIASIQRQLREHKESTIAESETARARSWRVSALHALRRKEQALARYKAWITERRAQIERQLVDLPPEPSDELLLEQAAGLLKRLLRQVGTPSGAPEYHLLDVLQRRVGLR